MGCTSGSSQLASRSIMNDFTDDVLTTSTDSLLQNGTVRILNFWGVTICFVGYEIGGCKEKQWRVTNGKVLNLVELRSTSHSLNRLALTLRDGIEITQVIALS